MVSARKGLTGLGNLLFPPQCPISGEPVTDHGTLSPGAWQQLRLLGEPWCMGCGRPFALAGEGPLCGPCAAPADFAGHLVGPRRLDRFRAALGYNDAAAAAILGLKYGDRHDGLAAFGRLMATAGRGLLPGEGADVLFIPVPLHRNRLRQRRYNQAGLLAGAVAVELGLPVAQTGLVRIRPTPSQKGASSRQRLRNVAGAFRMGDVPRLANTHIILIDDVLTTGATLLSCARTLRKAGARSVSGLTLARVMRDQG